MFILALFIQIIVVEALKSRYKHQLALKRSTSFIVKPFVNLVPLNARNNDNLDSLKLDESKISNSEKERLAFIQKLTLEADDIARKAGFSLGDEV